MPLNLVQKQFTRSTYKCSFVSCHTAQKKICAYRKLFYREFYVRLCAITLGSLDAWYLVRENVLFRYSKSLIDLFSNITGITFNLLFHSPFYCIYVLIIGPFKFCYSILCQSIKIILNIKKYLEAYGQNKSLSLLDSL